MIKIALQSEKFVETLLLYLETHNGMLVLEVIEQNASKKRKQHKKLNDFIKPYITFQLP